MTIPNFIYKLRLACQVLDLEYNPNHDLHGIWLKRKDGSHINIFQAVADYLKIKPAYWDWDKDSLLFGRSLNISDEDYFLLYNATHYNGKWHTKLIELKRRILEAITRKTICTNSTGSSQLPYLVSTSL